MAEIVGYELRDSVALLRFDDGRANVASHASLAALAAAGRFAQLSLGAYRAAKRKLRGALLERIRATLKQDMAGWAAP